MHFSRISLDNLLRLCIFLPSKLTDIKDWNFNGTGLINLGKAFSVAKKTVEKTKSTKAPASKKKITPANPQIAARPGSSSAKKADSKTPPPKKNKTPKNIAPKPASFSPKPAKKADKSKKNNEKPLTAAELKHFRQILMEKLNEILGDVDHIENEALRKSRSEATGDLSTMPIHMADLGSDNFEQEFALGLMDSEKKIVSEIIAALKRIDEGTYGICEGTGNPISRARLEANPWARYCIEHASQLEKKLAGLKYASARDRLDLLPGKDYDSDDEHDKDDDKDQIDEDVEYDLDKIEDNKEDADEQDEKEPSAGDAEDDRQESSETTKD